MAYLEELLPEFRKGEVTFYEDKKMSRSLDFTVCTRKCGTNCWRKLTKEEKEWLENNPNRQSYCSFDDCEYFTEDKKDEKEKDRKLARALYKELFDVDVNTMGRLRDD